MEALIFAETVFYTVVSLAIIVVGILLAIITYQLVRIVRNLRKISDNLSSMSKDTEKKVREILESLSESPILTFFMGKSRSKNEDHKGRNSK